MTTSVPAHAWERLASDLDGSLVLPDSPSYDQVRRPRIERFADVTPAAIVMCANPVDVATTLDVARRFEVPTAIRSGGHDFAGRSSTTGIVLDLSRINHVTLDGGVATVGAGTSLGDLYHRLHRHGRTIPGGCGATVGVSGLTLGGGLGVLGRAHGLTCDSLIRAEVVLADGRTVGCDEDDHPDLFWSLRGGGAGHLGVVTELVFDTISAPSCCAFELTWEIEAATRVLGGWQGWAPDAPPRIAASLLMNVPADPGHAPRVTVLGATHDVQHGETTDLLDQLTSSVGVPPRTTWQSQGSWLDTKTALADRAPGRDTGHVYSKSEFFDRSLPDDAIHDLVSALIADRVAGEARELDFSPWGGAYNRPAVDATAFPHRGDRFLLKHAATRTTDRVPASPGAWLTRSWRMVRPYGTGRIYPNFPDPDLPDPAAASFGSNLPRLARLQRAYDPEGMFTPLTAPEPSEGA